MIGDRLSVGMPHSAFSETSQGEGQSDVREAKPIDSGQMAGEFAELWFKHENELDYVGLRYVDSLIEELLSRMPMNATRLSSSLTEMVPRLSWGTAKRMIEFKFGGGDPGRLLEPSRFYRSSFASAPAEEGE